MDELEVRELRYFVAVAEELNFSRAAERLGISQPPLSRAIRSIERRLGTSLFERDTRRVSLTQAGMTLFHEAHDVLEAMSAAIHRTRRAGQPSSAMVATAKPGAATGLLRRIVDAYRALPDTSPVEIVVSGYRQQADMVRDGRTDVAVLSSPYEDRGLDAEPLASEPRVAALPADHRLARQRQLRCRDLQGEPIPQWTGSSLAERLYWSGRDHRLAEADANGHAADDASTRGPTVGDPAQLLEVVGLSQAVALIPRSVAEANPRSDVVYRPVADASPYVIDIAWPEGSRARTIARFVRVAIELCAAEHPDLHAADAADIAATGGQQVLRPAQ